MDVADLAKHTSLIRLASLVRLTVLLLVAQIAVALVGVVCHVEQLNLTELIPCLYRRQH